MSNFELEYTALDGIRSRIQGVGGNVANCSTELRRQVNLLSGQHGFGIESVRARVSATVSVATELSRDAYTTASFLKDLERSVSDYENQSYAILSGTVPETNGNTTQLIDLLDWFKNIIKPIRPPWIDWLKPFNFDSGLIKPPNADWIIDGDDIWKSTEALLKTIGTYAGNSNAKFMGDAVSYLKSAIDFFGGDKKGLEGYLDLLGLADASSDVYKGLYTWLKKGLESTKGLEYAEKFGDKYGGYIEGISLLGNGIGFSKSFLEFLQTYKASLNGDASAYDALSKYFEAVGDGVKFGASWAPSPYGQIISGFTSTITTAIEKYGVYSADGNIDIRDVSSIMIDSSLSGLNSMFLLGLIPDEGVDFIADNIRNFSTSWGKEARNYIDSNPVLSYMSESGDVGDAFARIYAITQVPMERVKDYFSGLFNFRK